ncbi:MAG TPA: methyltransferase domain-containing protein [Dehalococcoidia bacterium]|nr:methyltransferase domain-containing protein [Dehalococcoidia bacterium]
MSADTSFDGIAGVFEREIYGSSRGYIRLRVLWEDMLGAMPGLAAGGLDILDAGGGAGHLAIRLAACGHRVVLCDPSREMLVRAEAAVHAHGLAGAVTTLLAPIEDLRPLLNRRFDLVVCHAVLEWLADPRAAIVDLAALLRPSGMLSLMFYNRNATVLKRAYGGAAAEALRGYRDGFAPSGWGQGANPLAEQTVRGWLEGCGLAVRSKAGIRIFHDHVPEAARSAARLEELLALELALRGEEPFASLGRHLHLVCEPRQRQPAS